MPVDDLQRGDPNQVGPYRVLGRLGAGGMGVVYLVQAGRALGALKLIRPQLADDPEFRARFRHEVEAGRAVASRYTARFIDAQLEGTTPYLVTEYVEGPSLAEAVRDHGPLDFTAITGLARGLAEALQSIHSAGVIHRDLKPSNVLLSQTGPRIIDFGIARAMEATSVTRTGLSVGSPQWMAPEVARGEQLTSASDIFSWASVVVFAASGKPPFGEGRAEAVLYRIVHEDPDLTGVDARLAPVLRAALTRSPGERPTAAELVARVPHLPGGEVADPAAAATAIMSRTDVIGSDARPELTIPVEVSSRPKRSRLLIGSGALLILAAAVAGVVLASRGPSRGSPSRGTTSSSSTASLSTTTTTGRVPSTTGPATTVLSLHSELISISKTTAPSYQIEIAYPEVISSSTSASALAQINARLASEARKPIASFESYATKAATSGFGAGETSTLSVATSTDVFDSQFASFTYDVSMFTAGAAHPFASVETFNFDENTGQLLQLSDLFKPGSNWLAVLSQQSRALLPRLPAVGNDGILQNVLDAGTLPLASNFSGWALTPWGLSIQFQEYQVAPYAAGQPLIIIPFRLLESVALPNGPLALIARAKPVRSILFPAPSPPTIDECSAPITFPSGGGYPSPTCSNGDLNVQAWSFFAGAGATPLVLGLGAHPSMSEIKTAACKDLTAPGSYDQPALELQRETIADIYYGWGYSSYALPGESLFTTPHTFSSCMQSQP